MTIVIGDSLAVGFGAAAHIETHARVSASSCVIASFAPSGSADVIVVSAGINDPPGRCLDSLRARLHARRITWILPGPDQQRSRSRGGCSSGARRLNVQLCDGAAQLPSQIVCGAGAVLPRAALVGSPKARL